ncbi:MAG: hypothetical protein EB072_20805, partial [Betaproteobacteria bacterium]|nr:hypothetical protein [Betaproteobacteria bacterium]
MDELRIMIGHRRPDFELWPGHQFACFEPESENDFKLDKDEECGELLPDRLIGEYYFLFCLLKTLEGQQLPPRFVVNQAIGTPSSNSPHARTLPAVQAGKASIAHLMKPKTGDLLVGSLLSTKSVMAQYARHHPLRDWLRFLADAIDGGAIEQATALEASLANQLIPAPSVGTFPSAVFLSHLRILRGAALSFRNHGFIARDDYQRRAI